MQKAMLLSLAFGHGLVGSHTSMGRSGDPAIVETSSVERETSADWPALKTYDEEHLAKIALPLGGIGTGTVSLGGRGDLRDWEIMNRPAKGFIQRGDRPARSSRSS